MFQECLPGIGSREEDLYTLVYDELHRIASSKMQHESVFTTLQATALVHEAWIRLGGDEQPQWRSRAYFFSAAAEAMRRVLIDRARKGRSLKRGGDLKRVEVEDMDALFFKERADERFLRINDALEKFSIIDPQKAELVKLRYFVGLSFDEVARTLSVSESTAKRWWAYARSWLQRYMETT